MNICMHQKNKHFIFFLLFSFAIYKRFHSEDISRFSSFIYTRSILVFRNPFVDSKTKGSLNSVQTWDSNSFRLFQFFGKPILLGYNIHYLLPKNPNILQIFVTWYFIERRRRYFCIFVSKNIIFLILFVWRQQIQTSPNP